MKDTRPKNKFTESSNNSYANLTESVTRSMIVDAIAKQLNTHYEADRKLGTDMINKPSGESGIMDSNVYTYLDLDNIDSYISNVLLDVEFSYKYKTESGKMCLVDVNIENVEYSGCYSDSVHNSAKVTKSGTSANPGVSKDIFNNLLESIKLMLGLIFDEDERFDDITQAFGKKYLHESADFMTFEFYQQHVVNGKTGRMDYAPVIVNSMKPEYAEDRPTVTTDKKVTQNKDKSQKESENDEVVIENIKDEIERYEPKDPAPYVKKTKFGYVIYGKDKKALKGFYDTKKEAEENMKDMKEDSQKDVNESNKGRNSDVEIIENTKEKKRWRGIVTPKVLKLIEDYKYAGGFLRYEIDLYDDGLSDAPSPTKGLNDFMAAVIGINLKVMSENVVEENMKEDFKTFDNFMKVNETNTSENVGYLGIYNEYGFIIWKVIDGVEDNDTDNIIYEEGNSTFMKHMTIYGETIDTEGSFELDNPNVASIEDIKASCEHMTQKKAKDDGVKYLGIRYNDEKQDSSGLNIYDSFVTFDSFMKVNETNTSEKTGYYGVYNDKQFAVWATDGKKPEYSATPLDATNIDVVKKACVERTKAYAKADKGKYIGVINNEEPGTVTDKLEKLVVKAKLNESVEETPKYNNWYVGIPTTKSTEAWKDIASFSTKKEAIAFAKEKFGADDKGKICLVSNAPHDETSGKTYYVDLPNPNDEEMIFDESFDNKKEAVEYAKYNYGADDKGYICLVSQTSENVDDSFITFDKFFKVNEQNVDSDNVFNSDKGAKRVFNKTKTIDRVGYLGLYCEFGYKIWITDADGQMVDVKYEAGNSSYESTDVLDLDDNGVVSLETIKSYCTQTLADMCKEDGVKNLGIQYDEDEYNDTIERQEETENESVLNFDEYLVNEAKKKEKKEGTGNTEFIKKRKAGWVLLDKNKKVIGTHPTREEAVKQLDAIEVHKHE